MTFLTNGTATNAPKLKVLVAEDNIINQRLIVGLLTGLGHTGMVVNDGEKALKCLSKMKVDVVLTDVMMPNMDGMQALAAIRAKEAVEGGHLPVIMATAHDEPGEAARYKRMGADGYLAKPLEIDRLKLEIERVLALR
ncbi:MAG: response regulator [Rhodoferax sp.]|nr:response regulator [Rhodoferax sp.]